MSGNIHVAICDEGMYCIVNDCTLFLVHVNTKKGAISYKDYETG